MDRQFRPDIEGLRAVAVVLVVLYHASIAPVALAGGYVGVDVFFVLSGFLITGLLIRERLDVGSTSLPRFYARRVRRILPAATLVLAVTVVASYQFLGFLRSNKIAADGQWTAAFAANLHFADMGARYLNSFDPPSVLQHYWSLAVEEQFYLVWPLLFLIIAGNVSRIPMRVKLGVALGVIIAASFTWSVVLTAHDGNWAFYSPLTRAWELAIGAALAVSLPAMVRIPRQAGPWLSWAGLAGIVVGAIVFDSNTPFPSYTAALPVVACAAAVVGGTTSPGRGAEAILARRPFQWLGKHSYSLYLWHWPLLIIPTQVTGNYLTRPQKLGLLALAILLSAATYRVIENPIRRSAVLQRRTYVSLAIGLTLVLSAFGLSSWEIQANRTRPDAQSMLSSAISHAFAAIAPGHDVSFSPVAGVPPVGATVTTVPGLDCAHPILETIDRSQAVVPAVPLNDVLCLVGASSSITSLPLDFSPPLEVADSEFGMPMKPGCFADLDVVEVSDCVFGDAAGTRTIVLFGDSQAISWLPAFDQAGRRAHWKLILLAKSSCTPASLSTYTLTMRAPYFACDQWRQSAIDRINQVDPDLLVVADNTGALIGPGRMASPAQWEAGLEVTLGKISIPTERKVLFGNLPLVTVGNGEEKSGPICLAAHLSDVRACSAPHDAAVARTFQGQIREVARASDARYVDVTPWLCSTRVCTAVIGSMNVYVVQGHLSVTYATYLSGAVQETLQPMLERSAPGP